MAVERISVGLDFGNGHKREVGTLAFYEKKSFDFRGEAQHVIGFEYAEDVQEVLEGYSEDVLSTLLSLNGSSGGARPKAVIGFNPLLGKIIYGSGDLPENFEAWLLKFPMREDGQDAGAVEYVYSLMAREAGLEMPPTFLFRLKDSSHPGFFAVKRFDREKNRRFHLHSAAGLLNMNFRTDFLDYKDLLQLTVKLTGNPLDVEKIYRMSVFNVLAHNRDDHAKNFSFLMDETGKWTVSPAYDLTFSHGPGGYQSTSVMGRSKNPVQEDLEKLGQHFHLSDSKIKEIIERTKKALLKWLEIAGKYGISAKRIKEIKDKISI